MAYEKNTWINGDTITAEKLNHMEDGIANNFYLIANIVSDQPSGQRRLDKTFKQIKEAADVGKLVVAYNEYGGFYLLGECYYNSENGYYVQFSDLGWNFLHSKDIDSYPLEDLD